MNSIRSYDLRLNKVGGCTGDPVMKFAQLLNQESNAFQIITTRMVLPPEVVRLIAGKKGFKVDVVEETNDYIVMKVYRG